MEENGRKLGTFWNQGQKISKFVSKITPNYEKIALDCLEFAIKAGVGRALKPSLLSGQKLPKKIKSMKTQKYL